MRLEHIVFAQPFYFRSSQPAPAGIAADPSQKFGPSVTYPVTNCTLQGPKIKATCVARVSLLRNGATTFEQH
jgi:hypothetical protein